MQKLDEEVKDVQAANALLSSKAHDGPEKLSGDGRDAVKTQLDNLSTEVNALGT